MHSPRRSDRYNSDPTRKTYSAYLDRRVIEAVDSLVQIGRFPNRSEAIEEACKRLVSDVARESVEASAA